MLLGEAHPAPALSALTNRLRNVLIGAQCSGRPPWKETTSSHIAYTMRAPPAARKSRKLRSRTRPAATLAACCPGVVTSEFESAYLSPVLGLQPTNWVHLSWRCHPGDVCPAWP